MGKTAEIIKKAKEKIAKDLEQEEEKWKAHTPEQIIRLYGYEIAHCNEIGSVFENADEEDEEGFPICNRILTNIIEYKGNAVEHIYRSFLNYNHPERYNFFWYDDLIDIISHAFDY